MDGPTLQNKVYSGYAKAAARVGTQFKIYRPTTAFNPLQIGNQIGVISAAFTVHSSAGFNFNMPSDWAKPTFHALLDPTQVLVGDYLVPLGNTLAGPFFIAGLDPVVPPLAVQCTRVINVLAQGGDTSVGLGAYSGNVALNSASTSAGVARETIKLQAWPAALLMSARAPKDAVLPGNDGTGTFRVMLPSTPGVVIQQTDIITDDLGNRYAIVGVERQDLGWRIDARQVLI